MEYNIRGIILGVQRECKGCPGTLCKGSHETEQAFGASSGYDILRVQRIADCPAVPKSHRGTKGELMGNLLQDARFGVRMLTKNPAFSVIAILTLAIGIGANTAIFSVANAVLFRPLPYRDPSRLVTVMDTKASEKLDWLWTTQANFVEWRRRADVFETMAASNGCGFRIADDNEVHFLSGSCVSLN